MDVLIEGYRPGVTERLGFGPEECLAANPCLIYGRMTGWGQTGPLAPGPATTPTTPPSPAVLDSGRRHGGAPWRRRPWSATGGGGLMLAWGIACALLEAQRSGQGQVIDAAMCDGAAVLGHGLYNLQALGGVERPLRHRFQRSLLRRSPVRDGQWLSVCPLEPQFYVTFLARLGLTDDPDFAGKQYDTTRWPAMKERLTAIFQAAPRAHWEQLFADTDDCVWPVLTPQDAPDHPHNQARGSFQEVAGVIQPAPAAALLAHSRGHPGAAAGAGGEQLSRGAALLRYPGGDRAAAHRERQVLKR